MKFYEQLSQFETKEQFAEWIKKTLSSVYLTGPKNGQTSDLYVFTYGRGLESTTEAMAILYEEKVSKQNKSLFRSAIGLIFRKYARENKIEIPGVAEDLIYLVGRINAIEALDDLLTLLSNKQIIEKNPDLLFACLGVIQSLSPREKVEKFAAALARNQFFDDSYLFTIIGILINNPEKSGDATKIVDEFGRRISELYNKAVQRGEEKMYWEVVSLYFDSNTEAKDRIIFYSK